MYFFINKLDAYRKYGTKVIKRYKQPKELSLKEIINLGFPDINEKPTSSSYYSDDDEEQPELQNEKKEEISAIPTEKEIEGELKVDTEDNQNINSTMTSPSRPNSTKTKRMLRKEKKRQRRLLRGVMNSACYWFSLYQKIKDKMYYN